MVNLRFNGQSSVAIVGQMLCVIYGRLFQVYKEFLLGFGDWLFFPSGMGLLGSGLNFD